MRFRVDGSGPNVVKIAGIAGGVEIFREEIDAAVANGFRVAAVDTAGDRLDDPASRSIDWDFLCDEIREGLDAASMDRAVLWGSSFGSLVAIAFAVRHAERTSGLLLSFPPDPGFYPWPYRKLMRFVGRRRRPEVWVGLVFPLVFGGLLGWEMIVPATWVRAPRIVRAALDAATPWKTVYEKLRLMWETDPLSGVDRIDAPSHVIAGRLDAIAPLAGARRVASCLRGAPVDVLPHAGHAGHYAYPRRYATLAIDALARLTSKTARGRTSPS